ncbi:MAG TPA: hypothetical protein V6D02_17065 [Candidatus Obscuribacterales bacterium]
MDDFPFNNPNAAPLPDANEIEKAYQEARPDWRYEAAEAAQADDRHRSRLEADKQLMRNLILRLLIFGLVIGGLLSVGLVWTLGRLDLLDPPALHQNQ